MFCRLYYFALFFLTDVLPSIPQVANNDLLVHAYPVSKRYSFRLSAS